MPPGMSEPKPENPCFGCGAANPRGAATNGWFRYEQVCLRYGKLHFMFPGADDGELERLKSDGKPQRVLLVVRPQPGQEVAR